MAAISCVLSEDQFRCPICLEVFTAPVSTPCGHNFCKHCIEQHWDCRLQCPVCNEGFSSRPQLKTNTTMAEMVSQFKSNPPLEGQVAGLKRPARALEEGDVPCDLCSGPRLKAIKSCLLCLASYCPDHLQPHISNPRLKRHQLIEVDQNLEERICPEHNAPLEMFCRDDSKLICLQCFSEQHKAHSAVPLKVQRETNEETLKGMIRTRRRKVEEIQGLVELSWKNADQEIQDGVKVFDALMECVKRSLYMFKNSVEEKHKKTEKEATALIQKIRKEITELEQKEAELKEMSSSEDHLRVLQKFSFVRHNVDAWAKVSMSVEYKGGLINAVTELQNKQFADECKKVFKTKLRRLKQFDISATFDPDTAHVKLQVSKDKKKVRHLEQSRCCLFSNRFQSAPYVLGKQKFSSGQFYFEVLVRGKIMWAVGVAKESAWTSVIFQSYDKSHTWLMTWDNEKYHPAEIGNCSVSVKSVPEKIGVFVDYEEHLVSFYDADTAVCIGSIENCRFQGNIQPIFSPGQSMDGKNSEPLKLGDFERYSFAF